MATTYDHIHLTVSFLVYFLVFYLLVKFVISSVKEMLQRKPVFRPSDLQIVCSHCYKQMEQGKPGEYWCRNEECSNEEDYSIRNPAELIDGAFDYLEATKGLVVEHDKEGRARFNDGHLFAILTKHQPHIAIPVVANELWQRLADPVIEKPNE